MLLISCRGNIDGINKSLENDPEYIVQAIQNEYHVMIDLWVINDELFTGEKEPRHNITVKFLHRYRKWLYIAAKNIEALNYCISLYYNVFWHEFDDYTVISTCEILAMPNVELSTRCIAYLPEESYVTYNQLNECIGVCSNTIKIYRDIESIKC